MKNLLKFGLIIVFILFSAKYCVGDPVCFTCGGIGWVNGVMCPVCHGSGSSSINPFDSFYD